MLKITNRNNLVLVAASRDVRVIEPERPELIQHDQAKRISNSDFKTVTIGLDLKD